MDISEAVLTAKKWVATMFADEGIINLGLEEAYFDESHDVWHITLGFSRPWDNPQNVLQTIIQTPVVPKRTYKIVEIPDKGDKQPIIKNYQNSL